MRPPGCDNYRCHTRQWQVNITPAMLRTFLGMGPSDSDDDDDDGDGDGDGDNDEEARGAAVRRHCGKGFLQALPR